MFAEFPMKRNTEMDWEKTHKKIGQIFRFYPCDSDIQEGQFMEQLWFHDGYTLYLLAESDIREE